MVATGYYLKDAIYVLLHFPEVYLFSMKQSLFIYLLPGPSKDYGEGWNDIIMKMIKPFEQFYNKLFLWQVLPRTERWTRHLEHPNFEVRSSIFWIVVFPFLLVYILFNVIDGLRGRQYNAAYVTTVCFMWFTTVYVSIISVAVGTFACNRYRFPVEPFVLVFAAIFMYKLKNIRQYTKKKISKYFIFKCTTIAIFTMLPFTLLATGTDDRKIWTGGINKINPNSGNSQLATLYAVIGEFFLKQGWADKASRYFGKATMYGYEDYQITKVLATPKTMRSLYGPLPNDSGPLIKVADTEYAEFRLLNMMSRYQAERGNSSWALSLFEEVSKFDYDDVAMERTKRTLTLYLNRQGRKEAMAGNLEGAIALFSEAVEADPTYADSYNSLGYVHFLNGDMDKAEGYFMKTLEIDPDNEQARQNLEFMGSSGNNK